MLTYILHVTEILSFILNLLNTEVLVLGLTVGEYKFAASRQLSQRMGEVLPVAFLVRSNFSVILLVVTDKKIFSRHVHFIL